MGNESLIANLQTFKARVSRMSVYAFNQNVEQFKLDIAEITDRETRTSALEQLEEIEKYRIYFQDYNLGMIQRNVVPKIQKLIDSL